MTPEQTTGLQAALSVKIGDPVIARDVAEARPLIEKLGTPNNPGVIRLEMIHYA